MPDVLIVITVFVVSAAIGAIVCRRRARAARGSADLPVDPHRPDGVGIGTVRSVAEPITVDVESISGQCFVGRLRPCLDGLARTEIRAGVVLLVTFDPATRECLSLADDIVAVRTSFDQMLVGKGLVTPRQLALIRHGTRSCAVVTAMMATGITREDHREVELDLMVSRPAGGQFPAHETALIPRSAVNEVEPGCVIDAYYADDDESSVTVCVPPG